MDKLSGSEAVYGFMGWLTSTADLWSDCALAAQLVDQFCKANSLEPPGEGWPKHLVHPPKPILNDELLPRVAMYPLKGLEGQPCGTGERMMAESNIAGLSDAKDVVLKLSKEDQQSLYEWMRNCLDCRIYK